MYIQQNRKWGYWITYFCTSLMKKSQETCQLINVSDNVVLLTGHSSTTFGFGQKKKFNDSKGIIKS
jgi:hypothetical protein